MTHADRRIYLIKELLAEQTQYQRMYPGIGVDAVVDAAMAGDVTASHSTVSGVDDGITAQSGNVPLPEIYPLCYEYFHLGVNPIFRESYIIGSGIVKEKGYQITDTCIGCDSCAEHCPQRCIEPRTPYQIQQEHCLHCGNCHTVIRFPHL